MLGFRELQHEILMQQLAEKGLTGKGMEFYLEIYKLGRLVKAESYEVLPF